MRPATTLWRDRHADGIDGETRAIEAGLKPGSPAPHRLDAWRATLSGLCASFAGIGLARFAYTPLLPALVDDKWFTASSAAYLGAANLAGYLVGVIIAGLAPERIDARWKLRGAMAMVAASFFACAWPAGFAWFFGWRLLSGVAGGVAMILAAPTILPHIRPARRGLVSGAVFMGIGLGIAMSGTLIPLLLENGLSDTWLWLGAIATALAIVGWGGWPPGGVPQRPGHRRLFGSRSIAFTAVSYGFNAFGLVPHMLFLVAFVAHGLGQGIEAGTRYWMIFGLGAIVGPVLLGHVADRIGARRTLRLTLCAETVFVALPLLSSGSIALVLSSGAIGACTIGIVPVTLGRTREILAHHPAMQSAAWRAVTACFALFQAIGAYSLSFVFSHSQGNYRLLFAGGAGAMVAALLVELAAPAHPETA